MCVCHAVCVCVCVYIYIYIASLSPSQSFPLSIHTQFISNLYAQNIWTLSPQVYIKYFPLCSSIPCLYPVNNIYVPLGLLIKFLCSSQVFRYNKLITYTYNETPWIQILTLLFINPMTLNKLFNVTVSQCLSL